MPLEPATPLWLSMRSDASGTGTRQSPVRTAPVLRGAVALGLTIRVLACFASYSVLRTYQMPPLVFVFFLNVLAAGVHIAIDRGLIGWGLRLRRQLPLVGAHAAWQALSMLLWATALLMFHPLHVVPAEYFEYMFVAALAAYAKRRAASPSQPAPPHTPSAAPVVSTPATPPSPPPAAAAGTVSVGLLKLGGRFAAALGLLVLAHGFFEEPEGHPPKGAEQPERDTAAGALLLLAYCGSEVLRKSYRVWLVREVGKPQRVQGLSTLLAGALLLPPLLLYSSAAPAHARSTAVSLRRLLALLGVAALAVLAPALLAARYPAVADLRGRVTSGSGQCAMACGMAWLCHFFVQYKEDDTPLDFRYTLLLFGAFAAQCWALRAAQRALARHTPASVDPFSDYELPDAEQLWEGRSAVAAVLADSGQARRLGLLLLASAFYAAVQLLFAFQQGAGWLLAAALRNTVGAGGVAHALHAAALVRRGEPRADVVSGAANGALAVCAAVVPPSEGGGAAAWGPAARAAEVALAVLGVALCLPSAAGREGGTGSQLAAAGVCARCIADGLGAAAAEGAQLLAASVAWWAAPVVQIAAAAAGVAAALPVLSRCARILCQSVDHPQLGQLDGALRALRCTDGVGEVRSPRFWMLAPGRCVGSVALTARPGHDGQLLLRRAQALLRPAVAPRDLTVQIERAAR